MRILAPLRTKIKFYTIKMGRQVAINQYVNT